MEYTLGHTMVVSGRGSPPITRPGSGAWLGGGYRGALETRPDQVSDFAEEVILPVCSRPEGVVPADVETPALRGCHVPRREDDNRDRPPLRVPACLFGERKAKE
jgi:hypothetical protein